MDYREIVIWDNERIHGFFGEFRYLSNFHICDVVYEGYAFNSSEHAYMFAKIDESKTNKQESYDYIKDMTPAQVRKWGRSIPLRPDWEKVKTIVMADVVWDKFNRNINLKEKLLATGNKELVELNYWGDSFWGVDIKKGGQNALGKILMATRTLLREEKT